MEEVDFITAVRNAAYNEYGAITCEVQFEGAVDTRGEPIWSPFTATSSDVTDYGRQLYHDLVNGKYGTVSPFTVSPEMLDAAKASKRQEINDWRVVQEEAPLTIEYEGHQWQVDAKTLQRIDTAASMRNIAGSTFYWGDADNEDVPLTGEQLQGLRDAMFAAVAKRNNDLYKQSRAMKEALDELTDLETIRAFKMPT